MKRVAVYRNQVLAGELRQLNSSEYEFIYDQGYLASDAPAISLTLPKRSEPYKSDHLFSVFYNMLSEGANLDLQLQNYKLDKRDYLSLLVHTAQFDAIGPITFKSIS